MSGRKKASPDGSFDPREALAPERALVPAVMRVNERRVAQGLWPKLRRVASKIPFASEALSVWYCAQDPQTPLAAKGMMLAALAYFVLPTDAIPDFIAVLGYTDDAAVFAVMMTLVGKNLKPRHREAAQRAVAAMRTEDQA